MKAILICLPLALLTACTTTSVALPAGNNTYVISSDAGLISPDKGELINQTIVQANQTCANFGKGVKVISTTEKVIPSIWTDVLRATVTFKCE
jgi:hypothetical protein